MRNSMRKRLADACGMTDEALGIIDALFDGLEKAVAYVPIKVLRLIPKKPDLYQEPILLPKFIKLFKGRYFAIGER